MNNILVIVMSVILIGACVIGFIMEYGGGKDEEKDNKKNRSGEKAEILLHHPVFTYSKRPSTSHSNQITIRSKVAKSAIKFSSLWFR
ncbi:hypothetical protein [Ruminococcus sp.]|uniref:hypothetical protein n=1 Tax=Ruminococcus sp. TaxID=41978 RepID=UPI0025826C31|nr:hypothetical protein [Ruminococcus sp.]MCR5021774.1 hypothetical protein [Ruminococcus sp.]